MKKIFVVLAVVAFGFTFASCNKECKCSGSYQYGDTKIPVLSHSLGTVKASECTDESYPLPKIPGVDAKDIIVNVTCKAE